MISLLFFLGIITYFIIKLVKALDQRNNGENVSLVGPILGIVVSGIVVVLRIINEIFASQTLMGM